MLSANRHLLWASLGAALLLVATAGYGLGVGHDSVNYLMLADNLADEGRYATLWGETTIFPPLYPALLAVGHMLGDAEATARAAHALLFGGVLAMASWLMARREQAGLHTTAMILLLTSPALRVGYMLLTELGYIFITTAMLALMVKYGRGRERWLLGVLVGVTALAPLARYIGMVNVALLGAWLLVIGDGKWLERALRAAILSGIAAVPSLIWLARNFAVDGTLMGPRYPSEVGLLTNAGRVYEQMAEWIISPPFHGLAGVLIIGLAGLAWWARGAIDWRAMMLPGGYISLYLVALVGSASRVAYQGIDYRLVAPVFVPLVLVGYFALAGVLDGERLARRWRRAVWLLVGLVALRAVMMQGTLLVQYGRDGVPGYQGREWAATAAYLETLPGDAVIYATYPEIVWYLTDGREVAGMPHKHGYNAPEAAVNSLEQVDEWWPGADGAYVVEFDAQDYVYTVDELAAIAEAEMVRDVGGVRVWRVRERE